MARSRRPLERSEPAGTLGLRDTADKRESADAQSVGWRIACPGGAEDDRKRRGRCRPLRGLRQVLAPHARERLPFDENPRQPPRLEVETRRNGRGASGRGNQGPRRMRS
jgi:hypothetical protein